MKSQPLNHSFKQAILSVMTPQRELGYKKARPLQRQIAKDLKLIRGRYRSLVLRGEKSNIDQLVADHFYLIEREGKYLLREADNLLLPLNQDGNSDTIALMRLCVLEPDFRFTTESLLEVIDIAGQKRLFQNFELDFFPGAAKAAAISVIREYMTAGEGAETIVSHAIAVLFAIKSIDMSAILRQKNALHQMLQKDPSGDYTQMNEQTQGIYRAKLCVTAIRKGVDELALAADYLEDSRREGNKHVGFRIYEEYNRLIQKKGSAKAYIPLLFLTPAVFSVLLAFLADSYWIPCLVYFPLWAVFKPLIDYFCLLPVKPEYLPRMELHGEIPRSGRTLITIATLLPNAKEIPKLGSKLEKIYMTNKSGEVRIALLADLKESEYPTSNDDELLIQLTRKLIKDLNRKYDDSFLLVVRKRSYSKTQRVFTGYERKRGAIDTLVGMIKGQSAELEALEGDREYLRGVKYLYVLDYDTKALMDTAEQLVSIAMHPLNRPVLDEERNIVTQGYGILAPRVGIDLKESLKTPFAKIMGGLGGISAYDKSCGDLYQDLFGEGIFAGKGLIDVEMFYRVLRERFPNEVVLSHDILEGSFLRTAFVSDVELLDGFPQSASSYFKRLHRWIRGDFQNIPYLLPRIKTQRETVRNPLNGLSRFKLFDNLRRELTPFVTLRCLVLAAFVAPRMAAVLTAVSVLSVISGFLFSMVWTLFSGGFFSLSRKYYSRTLPQTFELLAQSGYELILLPKYAVAGLDAAIRAIWRRVVSHRKLMEWTTAAQTERGKNNLWTVIRTFWYTIPLGAVLLYPGRGFLRVVGLLFVACIPLVLYSQRKYPKENQDITEAQSDAILSYAAAMWGFYRDYATERENYLPPDNMQEAPIYQVAHRTSPTNIGMMLLSVLSARDLNFIDSQAMAEQIGHTLNTVERLEKFHGNLYNWYHTKTLHILEPQYVSTVDSGNFVCALVALKEGLKEYIGECGAIRELISRAERLIDETDLSVFYDKNKNLFSIGYDPKTERLSESCYDMLMSEARMTSYFAIAKRQVPLKHWSALGRMLARLNFYTGPLSWTGTMFEYYMPELLLDCIEGSLGYEGLQFCLYCQKHSAHQKGIPFGVSESGYYAFDTKLNYQYHAFGVQKLALKKGQDRNTVISPYSSFLVLPYDLNSACQNLEWLKRIGAFGKYGFYEAVDFTKSRIMDSRYQVVKSYMAHHVGMSIVAANNALNDGIMQRRFQADHSMNRANELLQEKVLTGSVIFEDIYKKESGPKNPKESPLELEYNNLYPQAPRVYFLSNGELTTVLTDCGASFTRFQDKDLTRRPVDLLRRPIGVFAWVKAEEQILPFTYAPDYQNELDYRVKISGNSISYLTADGDMQVGMKVLLHERMPCEQRQFVVLNSGQKRLDTELLIYLEPSLAGVQDDSSHPAFSRMFVQISYDAASNALIVTRRSRGEEETICCAIGFLENIPFEYEANRENLMERPKGVFSLREAFSKSFSGGSGTPDPCIALKCRTMIAPKTQKEYTLILSAGRSRAQAINNLIALRAEGAVTDEAGARSALPNDSLEGRLAATLLPQLFFPRAEDPAILDAIQETKLNRTSLWQYGISGDWPIVLLEVLNEKDIDRVHSYLSCHKRLSMCHIEYDLVLSYQDNGEYLKPALQMIRSQIDALDQWGMVDRNAGVHLIGHSENSEVVELLRAAACHIAPKSMVRIQKLSKLYTPIQLQPVRPIHSVSDKDSVNIHMGRFDEGSFTVTEPPKLPWCHVLSNPAFGTLVSDKSLGFTWAVNARENKLTPWSNDTMTDNQGELLIVQLNGEYYNLIDGAEATFSMNEAVYSGSFQNIRARTRVSVRQKSMCKQIEVELENCSDRQVTAECAYYLEPVLGVDRQHAKYLVSAFEHNSLTFTNRFWQTMPNYMRLSADTESRPIRNRSDFWSGRWNQDEEAAAYDPCGVLIVKKELPPRRKEKISFTLSYSAAPEALETLSTIAGEDFRTQNHLQIQTPDQLLDKLVNTWLVWQTASPRIFARTGFYQCGGAWGYRDQLQDAANLALVLPAVTKRQILRAAASQFIEGDVLHWWHNLPPKGGGKRGVRTRYSDDLLWLVYAVCEYLEKTNDWALLDTEVSYADGPLLDEEEKERYFSVKQTEQRESVYRHCVRAINRAYRLGRHGLVLMGCGDWNDGYNRVGAGGQGESVWLTQFLALLMKRFSAVSRQIGEEEYADQLIDTAQKLLQTVEETAWDGAWYLRAYFDNGEKMGSRESEECRIDSLTQSFSVLSGMKDKGRQASALQEVYEQLADREHGLVRLFTPAFQSGSQDPGYVKAYPAGLRENGGQYTHAAVWYAMALLQSGNAERGYELIRMLNPAQRYAGDSLWQSYLTEPYYMAADIYTNPDAYARGGWSVYTGAAGWYYKTITEDLLGIRVRYDRIELKPCLPREWNGFSAILEVRGTKIDLRVQHTGTERLKDNGQAADYIPLDGAEHKVMLEC